MGSGPGESPRRRARSLPDRRRRAGINPSSHRVLTPASASAAGGTGAGGREVGARRFAALGPYASLGAAVQGGEDTPYTESLDGDWRLTVVDRPDDVPAGFYREGYDVSGWPHASVPHTWQTSGFDHPMFRNIPEEVWPDDPPRVPHDVNATGAYVRRFTVPGGWDGRRSFLRFEGVTSGYFVWVQRPLGRLRPGRLRAGRVRRHRRGAPGRQHARRAGPPLGLGFLARGLRPVALQRDLP